MDKEYISIFLTIVIAVMGWKMQMKTERIKIMENQLSDKKYKAYEKIVGLFYSILKDIKKERESNQRDLIEVILECKKNIFMYGSDNVIKAFNRWLCSTTMNETQYVQLNAFLDFMIEIRKDMSGRSTVISKQDLLINLLQDKNEVNKFWKEITKMKN